ncbi:MAG: multidrug effflux MFS transporter [Alphaproteobacteria bacterium]
MKFKYKDYLILLVIIIIEIAIWSETDMFVPSMPDMVTFFGVSEQTIQNILSINFLGLSISALITGPVSDAYGRRQVMNAGMLCFAIASIGCAFTNSFGWMLFFRFIQGFGAGVPMVLAWVIIIDLYTEERVMQASGWINSIITAVVAIAPIIGSYINRSFSWRGNFIAIGAFAILAFVTTIFIIPESHPIEKRRKLSLKNVAKDYFRLLRNYEFIGNVALVSLNYSGVMLYISSLSLIFINHLNVSIEKYGYLQASTMIIYMIASGLNSVLIKIYGSKITNYIGCSAVITGSSLLMITGMFFPKNIFMICSSMGIFTAGVAISIGIIATRALIASKELKGTGSGLFTVTRLVIIFCLIEISSKSFTGSITPIATIIFVIMIISVLIYYKLPKIENDVSRVK